MQIFLFAALVFSLGVAIFAIQNAVQVTVNFLFWNFQTSLVVVILSSAVIGAMAISSVGVFRQYSLSRRIKECKKRVKELESKVQQFEQKAAETSINQHKPDSSPLNLKP